MLFNSYEFIFLFLPITVFIFYLTETNGYHQIAVSWLVGVSLFFYSWWNPSYLWLILTSIFFNYAIGIGLGRKRIKHKHSLTRKTWLTFGVLANLLLLGYY